MIKFENDCCDCATESYPCRGSDCPMRHVKHLYCDKCHEDVDNLYEVDGLWLCEACTLESHERMDLEDGNT